MFLFCSTLSIFGVRMQAEQSSVGKVLSSWAMCPPMVEFALDEVDADVMPGKVERSLDAGHPGTDDDDLTHPGTSRQVRCNSRHS